MRAILTYHSVDSTASAISVTPAVFERHVRWLASSGIAVVPLPDLVRIPDEVDAVAVTFDDAYTNFQQQAWPRLREYGLSATLFVPTRFVGRLNDWAETPGGRMPRLPILDWSTLARLQDEGVILGAHTRTHADLRSLDTARVEDEVWGSVEDLRRETGRRPTTFAYPYGYWTPTVVSVVRSACECACTTELRPLGRRDPLHLLPRLDIYYLRRPRMLENFGRAQFRAYLHIRSRIRTIRQRLRSENPPQ